jgi:type IV pilus assembly protein PilM
MNSIGLDIGSHSIKLVELRHTFKGFFLTNFAVKELPLEAGEVDRGVIGEKIKELLHEENIRVRKVTIGVSGPQIAIRRASFPSMPKKELKDAVRLEARKFISFPLEKAIVDFQLLGEIVEEGAKKLDLMVAVAEREFIENQLAIIKEAGLRTAGVGTIPHALWHSMQTIPEAREGVTALIDIGAVKTSINIVKDNKLEFSREITTAGNAFTKAIEEVGTLEGAALNFAWAEEIKKEYGILKEEDVGAAEGHVPLQKISFAMRPVLERLLTEINRSFEFHKSQFKEEEENVGRIFISGGGARLKGLKEYLSDQLGTRVELSSPFEDMAPCLVVATGLALGKAKEINLLPEELRLIPRVLLQKYYPGALACLAAFVLFGMYLKMNVTSAGYGKKLLSKKAELVGLQSVNKRLVQLEETKKRLEQEKAILPKEAFEQPPWGEILKEISRIAPGKTTLTGLSLRTKGTAKELRLKGVAFGGDAEVLRSIVEIMEGLDKSPFFKDARLSSSKENKEYSKQGGSFELRCEVVF